ncbi:hypothetical protein N7474_008285 [Penicillium riverlandense]|uniref:uncharacterized protein n=1 Tax=Penicillium riverlandense TaxID=1903569 RepID=UPI002548096E|nr:uncharacterized protein N7474_008285 [Penicillium riverlandense]KAJ5811984.1 hypothetical protein N7474_008285 [Penicillium riverlandense]
MASSVHSAAWQYSAPMGPDITSSPSNRESSPIYSTAAVVTNRLDAKVFAFYVKQAGPWLDIASSDRHFGETVPKLALVTPVLFYACLAYASRVLVLMKELDRSEGDRYHDQAITALIPQLSTESAALKNEALLATVVILRMSEQFYEVQNDMQCHLLGATSLFAGSNRWSLEQPSLEVASFWVYIRQNIRMCFLNEQPCQFDLDASALSISYSPAPETIWANRITYLAARICNECWKVPTGTGLTTGPKESWDNYDHLQSSIERWGQSVPDSFQPWCHIQDEFEPFPIVRYVSVWHAIAWQYYYICKVMLALYGRRQTACVSLLEINQYMESQVLTPARLVCGITFSCDDVGAVINGSHLAAWCGQLFSGKEEQRRLLSFLQNFMHQTKWPNGTCCDRLQRIWAGPNQPWIVRSAT